MAQHTPETVAAFLREHMTSYPVMGLSKKLVTDGVPLSVVHGAIGLVLFPPASKPSLNDNQWEYLTLEYGITVEGYRLVIINDNGVPDNVSLYLSESISAAGMIGWELVNSHMVIRAASRKWVSVGDMIRGDTKDYYNMLMMVFKSKTRVV